MRGFRSSSTRPARAIRPAAADLNFSCPFRFLRRCHSPSLLQIVSGTYPPIPDEYDFRLGNLIDMLLARDEGMRPTSKQIFDLPLIQKHLASMVGRQVLEPGVVTGKRSRLTLGQTNGAGAARAAAQAVAQVAAAQGQRPPPLQAPQSPLSSPGPLSAPMPSGPPPGGLLTPAQRLAARKNAEIEARQQALNEAARESHLNKSVARDRHLQQFHRGPPGGANAPPQPSAEVQSPASSGPSAFPRGSTFDYAPAAAVPMSPSAFYGQPQRAPQQQPSPGVPGGERGGANHWDHAAGGGDTVLYGGTTSLTLPNLESLSVSGGGVRGGGGGGGGGAPSPWAQPRDARGGPQQGFGVRDHDFGADDAEEVEEVYEVRRRLSVFKRRCQAQPGPQAGNGPNRAPDCMERRAVTGPKGARRQQCMRECGKRQESQLYAACDSALAATRARRPAFFLPCPRRTQADFESDDEGADVPEYVGERATA